MRYFLVFTFILSTTFSYGQTYSKVISDTEIINFITTDILNDSIKGSKTIRRKIFSLYPDIFYYKDSADFVIKNKNTSFIFRYDIYNGRVFTNHLDTLFSRKDIDFFYQQIKGLRKNTQWKKAFKNSVLVDDAELDADRNAVNIMYSYSLPLFSADKRRVMIIKSFFCGLLCGGGAYYIYEKDQGNNWHLIRSVNEWGE
jgi:hypothetical protein